MRHATLQDLGDLLKNQQARKIDVVAPATSIRASAGRLHIDGTEPQITDDGVTDTTGVYLPTGVANEGIAEKLGIPVSYVRKMHEQRPDLWDANVNGWLHGYMKTANPPEGMFPDGAGEADTRSFLVRCFRGDDSMIGVARAFLSDRYRMIDNIDVLSAALDGIAAAGVNVSIQDCDLSDRRMYVRIIAPEITAMAEKLLKGYRNPFGDDFDRWRAVADREGLGFGGDEPVVYAGMRLGNSEVGDGAFSITPEAIVRVCKNGLTIKVDMMRDVHLGGRLQGGVIDWSEATQQASVELVRRKTIDAVRTFLSPEYLARTVTRLEEKCDEPVSSADQVKVLTRSVKITDSEFDGILNRFILGGQTTRGGVVNAITAHAQTVDDPDAAHTLEEQAVSLLV